MICKPEAVVMVFPALWAAAVVGNHPGTTKIAIAIAASIWIVACGKRRILGHLVLRIGRVSSATLSALPAHPCKYAASVIGGDANGPAQARPDDRLSVEPGIAVHAAWDARFVAGVASSVTTENLTS